MASYSASLSPKSPIPDSFKYSQLLLHITDQPKHENKIHAVFNEYGFGNASKMTDTLQGSIWKASQVGNKLCADQEDKVSVVKVTNRYLHKHSRAFIDGKAYAVDEDVLMEASILKYLNSLPKCPNSIVKYERLVKTDTDYLLFMEDGGTNLFDFCQNAHKLILDGKIRKKHWQKVVKEIFKQMIECIAFIHSKNVCHFDISLENWLISNVNVRYFYDDKTEKEQLFFRNNIQIKLCDFGVSHLFTSSACQSSKFCGKKNYKSPEVIQKKKHFDAKKNDVWCLGICLFMMSTGLAPWQEASRSDESFDYITRNGLSKLLHAWDVLDYVDHTFIDMIYCIFEYEENRFSIEEVREHSFISE